jgi:hypothetical protein
MYNKFYFAVEDNGPDVLGKVSDVLLPMDAVLVMKKLTMISYIILEIQVKLNKN